MPVSPCTMPISTSSKTAVRGASPLGALSFALRPLAAMSSSATTHVGPTSSDCGTSRMSGRPSTSMSSSSDAAQRVRGGAGECAEEGILDVLAAGLLPFDRLGTGSGPGDQVEGAERQPRAQAAALEAAAEAPAVGDAAREADRRCVEPIRPEDDLAVGADDLDRGPRAAPQVDGRYQGQACRAGRVLEDEPGRQDLEVGDLSQGGQDLVSLLSRGVRAVGQARVHVSDGHGAVVGGVGAHERTAAGAAHDASATQELDPRLEALEDRGDRAIGRTDACQVPAGERRVGRKLGPGQRQHDVIDLVTQRQDGAARRPLPGVRQAPVEGIVDDLGGGITAARLDGRRIDEEGVLGQRVGGLELAAGRLALDLAAEGQGGDADAGGHELQLAIGIAVLEQLPLPLEVPGVGDVLRGGQAGQRAHDHECGEDAGDRSAHTAPGQARVSAHGTSDAHATVAARRAASSSPRRARSRILASDVSAKNRYPRDA